MVMGFSEYVAVSSGEHQGVVVVSIVEHHRTGRVGASRGGVGCCGV